LQALCVVECGGGLLEDPEAGVGGTEYGIRLLQTIMDQSFPGLINEPLFDARCVEPANVRQVAGVLHDILTNRPIEELTA
jgi:hypothetical protein